jgi:hypothetical protein
MATGTLTQAKELNALSVSQVSLTLRWFRRHRLGVVGLTVLTLLALSVVFVPVFSPYNYDTPSAGLVLAPAGSLDANGRLHLLGTDHLSRDVFTRLFYGGRVSARLPAGPDPDAHPGGPGCLFQFTRGCAVHYAGPAGKYLPQLDPVWNQKAAVEGGSHGGFLLPQEPGRGPARSANLAGRSPPGLDLSYLEPADWGLGCCSRAARVPIGRSPGPDLAACRDRKRSTLSPV